MPRELTPEGRRKPRSWHMKDELDDKVLKTIENIAKATYNALGPAVSQAREKFGQAGIGSPVAQALPGVSKAISKGVGIGPGPAEAEAEQPQYGPRPPAYEPTPLYATGEKTMEMAEMARTLEGGPAPIKLPGGGEVTVGLRGAGEMVKYPWATAAIIDPERFAKENPKIAKVFTDPRTGKLDVEAIRSFEHSRIKEEDEGLEPDFTLAGRKSFEREVFTRIGGNPFTFNPKTAVDDASRFLPDLFSEVFRDPVTKRATVAWEDRDTLSEEEERVWQTEQKRFRASIRERAIAKNQQRQQMYGAIMERWDAAAGRAKLTKEARVALEKAQVKRPFELEKLALEEGEKKVKSFQVARRELRQQLESSLFKGKPYRDEESTKYYNAVLKEFDSLRSEAEGGRKDINPGVAGQIATQKVEDILNAFWADYNAPEANEEAKEKAEKQVKQLLGYIPLTPR